MNTLVSLSAEKTAILSVANAWGRRRLEMSPISLQLSGQPVRTVTSLRVLGLEISSSGSAALWLRSARQQAGQMLHLIRRMSQKAGGSCFKIARLLVRSILRFDGGLFITQKTTYKGYIQEEVPKSMTAGGPPIKQASTSKSFNKQWLQYYVETDKTYITKLRLHNQSKKQTKHVINANKMNSN